MTPIVIEKQVKWLCQVLAYTLCLDTEIFALSPTQGVSSFAEESSAEDPFVPFVEESFVEERLRISPTGSSSSLSAPGFMKPGMHEQL